MSLNSRICNGMIGQKNRTSHSPLMLSWVIGSRRMLSPRILLALFVLHLSPFCIRSIGLWGKTVIMCNQTITFDLQSCQYQEGASQSSYDLQLCHILWLKPWHHFLCERSVNFSNPAKMSKVREKPCMSKCLWARKHIQALIPILFYLREKLLWGIFENLEMKEEGKCAILTVRVQAHSTSLFPPHKWKKPAIAAHP